MPRRYRERKGSKEEFLAVPISIASILFVLSVIAVLINGLVIARPGIPALKFKETNCKVFNKTVAGSRRCECGGLTNDNPYCKSTFPCIQVHVQYNVTNTSQSNITTTPMTSLVHEHESVDYSKNSDCSFLTCVQEKRGNVHEVNIFSQKYGETNDVYPCFYDVFNPKKVIIKRNYSFAVIVSSLAVPGGVAIVTLFSLITLCICKSKNKKIVEDQPAVQRSYMNGAFICDSGAQNRCAAPRCDENKTYMREEDPNPPANHSTATV